MKSVLKRAFTGLVLVTAAASAFAAAEPAPPPAPPAAGEAKPVKKPKGPAHVVAMKTAAERWKIKNASKRLLTAGATGQHDLFWEILELFEKQEKARTDTDLITVMSWLLFDVSLRNDLDLGPAAARQIPNLVPELGQKLLVARLGDWVTRKAADRAGRTGNEPWAWAEFSGKNRRHLATAAAKLLETGPRHNPLTRIWISAALLAAGGKGADKELATTWKKLKQRVPSRAPSVTRAVATSLADGGVSSGLSLLLNVTGDELDRRSEAAKKGKRPVDPRYRRFRARYGSTSWPLTLTRFYSLLGWIPLSTSQYNEERARAALTTSRTWLKANLAKLKWDPEAHKYQGGAPQAGMEEFFRAASSLKKKYAYGDVDKLVARQLTPGTALLNLLSMMNNNQKMARDKDAGAVALKLLAMSGTTVFAAGSSSSNQFFERLKPLPKPLAAALYAGAFGDILRGAKPYSTSGLSIARATDPELLSQACAKLRPDFKKAYELAAKGTDKRATLDAAMRYLFLGGDIPHDQLVALIKNASTSTYSLNTHIRVWMEAMLTSGRTAGLRVCLARAQLDLAASSSSTHYIRQFGRYVGWYSKSQYRYPDAKTELAKALKWLPANESKLKWDKLLKRFSGAGAPGSEALLKNAAELEKRWGLKIRGENLGQRDGARKLFSEIMELGGRKPEIGKDEKLMALLAGLVEPGQIMTDTLLRKKLMVDVTKFSPKLGAEHWAKYIKANLIGTGGHGGSPSSLTTTSLDRAYPGYNRKVLPEACKALKPELKKVWEASANEKIYTRLRKGLAYVAVGSTLAEIKFEALLKEAEKLGSTTRLGLHYWGSAITALGNVEGLELTLIYATSTQHSQAHRYGAYLYAVGKSKDRYGRDLFRLPKDELRKKIHAELKWLRANKKNLKHDPATGRFKLVGKAVIPPDNGGKDPGPDVF